MKKQILEGAAAREALKEGVDKIASVVTTTLGPRGRNVAIGKMIGAPRVVHDGVTVAKSVVLEDDFENQGAQLVREASEKTNDAAGDGTTTAMLLSQAIIEEGMTATTMTAENMGAKMNPMKLRKELEDASEMVINRVGEIATEITTPEQKRNIATISAQDEEIGGLISEALELVGDDGVISVGEGKGTETVIEHSEGVQIERGLVSPYLISDHNKRQTEIQEVSVLVTDLDIRTLDPMLGFFETFLKKTNRILIIANKFEEQAITMLVMNKERGALEPIAVNAPAFGNRRTDALKDIALLTGAKFISKANNRNIMDITVEELGFADRVISDMDKTTIIGGAGDKKVVKERVKRLKGELDSAEKEMDKIRLRERIANLSGGVAVIHAGGATETEVEERRLRIEDAVHATRAAIEEGIVPGGGVIMLQAREVLKDVETTGAKILYKALEIPMKKVLENAGEDFDVIRKGIKKEGMGYDVVGEKYVDMLEAGIVDPAKVTKQALRNAISVANMVLTTEAIVVPLPDDKEKKDL